MNPLKQRIWVSCHHDNRRTPPIKGVTCHQTGPMGDEPKSVDRWRWKWMRLEAANPIDLGHSGQRLHAGRCHHCWPSELPRPHVAGWLFCIPNPKSSRKDAQRRQNMISLGPVGRSLNESKVSFVDSIKDRSGRLQPRQVNRTTPAQHCVDRSRPSVGGYGYEGRTGN